MLFWNMEGPMNLQQIRYFVTTAQLESVSKAAEIYHISQSSLSKTLIYRPAAAAIPAFNAPPCPLFS